jgi:hypothetical protein
MSARKYPVPLDIDQLEDICLGLSLIPSKSSEQRELHGKMCQLLRAMAELEPIT